VTVITLNSKKIILISIIVSLYDLLTEMGRIGNRPAGILWKWEFVLKWEKGMGRNRLRGNGMERECKRCGLRTSLILRALELKALSVGAGACVLAIMSL